MCFGWFLMSLLLSLLVIGGLLGLSLLALPAALSPFHRAVSQYEASQTQSAARAKENARSAELRQAVELTVIHKDFLEADYQKYITITVAYTNQSGKDIRAFQGKIQFTDLFGKEIYESGVTISDPIKAGASGTWHGSINYNQFLDADKALRSAELSDMKIIWKPLSVLFADGSKIEAES